MGRAARTTPRDEKRGSLPLRPPRRARRRRTPWTAERIAPAHPSLPPKDQDRIDLEQGADGYQGGQQTAQQRDADQAGEDGPGHLERDGSGAGQVRRAAEARRAKADSTRAQRQALDQYYR